MAGRLKLYPLIRKIHLYSSFTVLAFLLMYFATGFILTHADWFSHSKPKVETVEHPLQLPTDIDLSKLSAYIQKEFNIRAQRKNSEVNDQGEISIDYIRPGYHYKAIIPPDKGKVTLIIQKEDLYDTFVVFHRLHGFGGGGVYELYILMMDIASIALILFSLSGLFMWFQLSKNKFFGLLLLALGIGYTLFVLWSFMRS